MFDPIGGFSTPVTGLRSTRVHRIRDSEEGYPQVGCVPVAHGSDGVT